MEAERPDGYSRAQAELGVLPLPRLPCECVLLRIFVAGEFIRRGHALTMEYFQLIEGGTLPSVEHFAPFKAVLAIEDPISPARQQEVSDWLVEMGCKYVMVCGNDGDSWQETIRRANLEQVSLDDMQPADFVMITPHPHEKLRNVFWHASKVARHSHVKMENILTFHFAEKNRSVEYHAIFDKA
jgi:hypothetical protein